MKYATLSFGISRGREVESSPEEWPSPRLNSKDKGIQQGKDSMGQALVKCAPVESLWVLLRSPRVK